MHEGMEITDSGDLLETEIKSHNIHSYTWVQYSWHRMFFFYFYFIFLLNITDELLVAESIFRPVVGVLTLT